MKIEKLFELLERSMREEFTLRKHKEAQPDDVGLIEMLESVTQNGITVGIRQCIEALSEDKKTSWRRSHDIFCRVWGIEPDTGFGFWVPVSERRPSVEDEYIIQLDDGYIATAEFSAGKFELWADSGEVVAWMPKPAQYKKLSDEYTEV